MSIPNLDILDPGSPTPAFIPPAKRINDGADVTHFLGSKAYRDIGLFLMQLNRAMIPRNMGATHAQTWSLPAPAFPTSSSPSVSSSSPSVSAPSTSVVPLHPERPPAIPESTVAPAPPAAPPPTRQTYEESHPAPVLNLQLLLARIESFMAEAPPDPGPRRFGNVSFRRWHALLDQRAGALMDELIPSHVLRFGSATGAAGASDEETATAKDEIRAYFLGSFGSAQRLDYGTGHELSFLAFLGCLWKLNYFFALPSPPPPTNPPRGHETPAHARSAMSRAIVLHVIQPYLSVIRTLIQAYTLEPAGSHGVWGLDDHSFLPYVFGSAQLTRPIAETEPTPLEGSVPGAPRTGDVAKPETVERYRHTNMYFSAVGFICDVKKGPFWEHSPMLFDISGVRDGWGKINQGMIKMYNAEVLSKFPVVQHFPFGSLFSWDLNADAAARTDVPSIHVANQPAAVSATAVPPRPPVASMYAVPPGPGRRLPPHVGGMMPPVGTAGSGRATAPMAGTRAPWAAK